MEIDSSDEKIITDLYRKYQQTRDEIDQNALFNINKAAKVYLSSNADVDNDNPAIYQLRVMDSIRREAHDRYIKNRITQHSIYTEDVNSPRPGLSASIKQFIITCVTNLKKPVWIAALSGILIVLYYFMDPHVTQSPHNQNFVNDYQSTLLMENHEFVLNQINTTVDWQYGFVLEDPSGRDAFVAGAYLVDLLNLNQPENSKEIELLVRQLNKISARHDSQVIQNAIENFDLNPNQPESISVLSRAFESFYQSQPEGNYFEFGRWMEFNYLQTKLAIERNDSSIYDSDLKTQHNFIKSFRDSTNYPEFIKDDLNHLVNVYSLKTRSIENLQKQLELLEKLRILLF